MANNYFADLYSRDVSQHIEKKGRFSYLSWTYAVAEMTKADPDSSWEVIRFNGLPYLESSCGYFVEVAVTVHGKTRTQIHPVIDNNNKPITAPNAFQINTSIQRCLVKAIALHGLGLYIYAGEDLPEPKELTQEEKFSQGKEAEEAEIKERKYWQQAVSAQTEIAALRALAHQFPKHLKDELMKLAKEKSESLLPKNEAA